MKLNPAIFFGKTDRSVESVIRLEAKLKTGAMNAQTGGFNTLEGMLEYTSMNVEGERWFTFLAIDRGQSRGHNIGAGATAYVALYTQESAHDAALRLQSGETLPAYRCKQGRICIGVTNRIALRQSMRNGCRGELPIPGCHTEAQVKELCKELAQQRAKFLHLDQNADASRGWELLVIQLLLDNGAAWGKHTGDATINGGRDLQQKNDGIIGLRHAGDWRRWF